MAIRLLTVMACVFCIAFFSSCATEGGTTRVLFNGTFYGNEAESKMLPGQHVPPDFRSEMKDDGVVLQTVQTFTTPLGQKERYVWSGVCDGQLRPVRGAPGGAKLSCVRTQMGELINTVTDEHGYRHVETCKMSPNGVRQTCAGNARFPDGSEHSFVYVFDRNRH